MARRRLPGLLAMWLWLTACAPAANQGVAAQPFAHPGGMHSMAQLQYVQERLDQEPWRSAYRQLLGDAGRALNRTPQPVADFHVPAYYQYPAQHQSAKQRLSDDAAAAYALALAYRLADERQEAYAVAAVRLLNAWAATNRHVSGEDGPLVMCYAGVPLILAADLLADYGGWPATQRQGFGEWVAQVFRPNAESVAPRPNNHGAWGTFAAIAAAHYLDDRHGVAANILRIRQRIARTIAENGELFHENRRTNSGLWYTYFALAPLTGAMQIAYHAMDVDLYHYTAPNGRSLKQALDRYFVYCQHPESWPYRQPSGLLGSLYGLLYPAADTLERPTPGGWPGNLFEAMDDVYGETTWSAWVASARPVRGERAWLYPTLLPAYTAGNSLYGSVKPVMNRVQTER